MKFGMFDTHCHLQFPQYEKDRKEVIGRARKAGIGVINVGTDLETSRQAIKLAEQYDWMYATVGWHPNNVDPKYKAQPFDYEVLRELARHPKVVAIGECGLDFYRTSEEFIDKQKETFKKHIELAIEVKKPLVLHLRNAYDEALEILANYKSRRPNVKSGVGTPTEASELRGTSHFFSGTSKQAEKFLELGFYIYFAGPITFPPKADQPLAGAYEEVVKFVPLERILAETDAPFAAPRPWRGKRNEPAYVVEVVKKIAELKGLTFDEVARVTTKNAIGLFLGSG